ncbi:cingulin [Colossoma macropomum]|uniref:cingulin n=1 Tax=Colossoma macropomum TaxID=42526 RepID=UPI001863C9F0|nr:cingulin [Colossoma macropomum]
MSAPASGRKTPVDYGVQIRFIKDLHDTGGGHGGQSRREGSGKSSSRYGVAVRVQGIAGQPYVVLKEGEKGDSYGVQLRTQPRDAPPSYNSLPRRRDDGSVQGPYFSSPDGSPLRRAQSHGSLLDREGGDDFDHDFRRPPGDGRSGSYGNLDAGIGVGSERERTRGGIQRNQWGGSHQMGLNGSVERETLRGGSGHYTSRAGPNSTQTPFNRPIISSSGQAGSVGGSSRGSSPALDAVTRPNTASSTLSSAPSVALNTYFSPPSSSPASAYSSLGRTSGSVAKVAAVPSSALANDWSSVDAHVTPDLLMDQGQSSGSEFTSEEDQIQQMIYSVLRQGSSESDAAIKRRARIICDKIQALKVNRPDSALKTQLEQSLDENVHLQEQLNRKKTDLDQTHTELTQLRMDRENAESRVRQLEDQLAGLQDELRRETHNRAQNDTIEAELLALRTELAEAAALHQKQEDTLRQRERELTALKGALKEEVSTHDREMETLREQYSQDMEKLRASMEQVSQSQATIEAERQRVNSTVRSLQQQLEECKEEGDHWRGQFQSTREELRNTKQELLQARLEKEEFEEELKELQEKLNTMKQQIPDVKQSQTLNQELERCRANLKQAQAEVDKLKGDLDKKTMEIISLKRTNQELDAEQKYEIDRLKDQSRKDREELTKVHEKAKQLADPALVESLRGELNAVRGEAEKLRNQLLSVEEELQNERDRVNSSQTHIHTLTQEHKEVEENNTRLKEKITRLESQLQERVSQSLEAEQELQEESRRLRQQLDEAKRLNSKLGQERDELTRVLDERDKERETLRKENSQLDEQKRQHERTVDKLNKEIERLSADSSQSVQLLHSQLDEQKEKWRKEQHDLQKSNKEKISELEKVHVTLRSLQEELSRQKKELLSCCEERDNAVLDKELLTNRLRHLEGELESQRSTYNDRSREIRSMEDKVKHLELELDEEKNSVELLTDRITRSRDQIEQLRSELMQERSSKQDLELDKNALERQLKEYKSRVAEMEGQSRSSAGVSQLESRLQEMEERLRAEEREKNSALSSQRRVERKLKELTITLDEERQQHTEQRDQLALRVKALKRQVDEGEGEVERLDGLRRKAIRDMEEQMEQKEALQSRVTALENELKRKIQQARHISMDSSALSSDDDDDDGLYDPSSITSILTESNLQTSSC